MSVVLLVLLAIQLSERLKLPLVPYLTACIVAFGFSLPRPFDSHPLVYLRTLGESGLFLAIVIALFVASVFGYAGRLRGEGQSQSRAAPPLVAFCVALLFFGLFLGHVSLGNIVFSVLQPVARLGDSYVALIVIVGIETLLWVAGVHGPALLAAIVTPVYLTLQTQNSEAFAHHLPLPHIVVISLFLFVFPGGAGATFPLAGLLAISRIRRLRALGRVTLLPAIFNINEPLLFGLPLVFNPYLAVPFIVAPLVLATITYTVMALGWIARPIYYYPSSIPTLISTYLATLDLRAVALVVVNVLVAGIIYLPFVRAYERHLQESI
jgi:PTS system cellobiose-specific IIC component